MTAKDSRIVVNRRPGLVINQDYLPMFMEAGLDDFDRIYNFQSGENIKQIKERSIVRIEPPWTAETGALYLKRHIAIRPRLQDWTAGVLRGKSVSPGMLEFQSICDFREHGIPTVTPVAAGERKVGSFQYESFLMTESMEPFISLETIIRYHPELLQGEHKETIKKRLLEAIADVAGKMHRAGFNHLDFNADHVMIDPEIASGRISLALLDFQRIDRRKWMRFRWMIKTMAELFYSMPDPVFSDSDRQFMFEQYLGRQVPGWWVAFLMGWIVRKALRIGRHTHNIRLRQEKAEAEKRE